jgi:DNA invertase Pin-like site-specific DNA recombinase
LRRQEALAQAAAREEGVELDRTLTLADKGVSGFRGANKNKGALGVFLALVKEGIVPAGSVLIIEQVNRLSRLPWLDQAKLWTELLERGIIIRTCVPPARFDRRNVNELANGCPVAIFMMLAHQESQQKSDWVREAWKAKRQRAAEEGQPHGRRCPKWIEGVTVPHPRDRSRVVTTAYRLIPERAAVVRRIFALCREGYGVYRIWKVLETEGVPAFGRTDKWRLSYIKRILLGREAVGEYQPCVKGEDGGRVPTGKALKGYYPPVVTAEEWDAAQAAYRGRRHKGGRSGPTETNLFTHLAREAETGEPLQCHHSHWEGKRYVYLATMRRGRGIPYQDFEANILTEVVGLTAEDVDGRHQADELTARVDALQAGRAALGLELETLDCQIRELPPARWPKRVVARMAELEELIKGKDQELRKAKEAANTSGRAEALKDLQTCAEALAKLKGKPEEAPARRRIRQRLRLIVEGMWVHVERVSFMSRYVHVQLHLHGGERKYFCFPSGRGRPRRGPSDLSGCDFRAGDVGGHARNAEATQPVG